MRSILMWIPMSPALNEVILCRAPYATDLEAVRDILPEGRSLGDA